MNLSDKQTKKINQKKIVQKEDHHHPTKNGQLSHMFSRQSILLRFSDEPG